MQSLEGFVELDRRFSVVDGSMPPEESAERSYLLGATRGRENFNWCEVLAHRLVVVLGEPGSGKSWEFRNVAVALADQGQETFYIELERLVSRPLHETLDPEDQRRFQKWLKGKYAARFFLDSVDEAKLRRVSDFHTALGAIRNAIGASALSRASFVVSSRISEWQPATDRAEVLARLAPSPVGLRGVDRNGSSANSVPPILILEIDPLNPEQVRKFVVAKDIADADRFIAAIDEHHAWEFARRPMDVISLVQFWQVQHRLGTLTEMIEHDVVLKLRETMQRQKNFPLSEADARLGAETLAAATLLCEKIQFKVPDDAFVGSDALDSARCLPARWSFDQCAALLSRPLFDSATYGTIRFHHRRVAEYLAAAWLRTRMVEGCPTHVLLELLFSFDRGIKTARRGLIPVTAWLCSGNASWTYEVRSRVLATAPEMHLEYGDAGSLPLDYRRAVLRAIVQRNEGRERVWLESSPEALRRLAAPDLATDISALLQTAATSADIVAQLIMLVRFGQLRECLPTLLTILSSAGPDDDIQVYVLAALRDMGTEESLRQAWEILRAREDLPDHVAAVACEALYPQIIAPKDLAALFMKTQTTLHDSMHLRLVVRQHFHECLGTDESGKLLVELNRLAQVPPHVSFDGKETRISDRNLWILDVIPIVLLRLLESDVLTTGDCGATAEAIALLGESRHFPDLHNDDTDKIDAATRRHPQVRRAFFWEAVARRRSEGMTGRPSPWLFFTFNGVVSANSLDIEWLLNDLVESSNTDDEELCLEIALQLGAAVTRRGRQLLREVARSKNHLARRIRTAVSAARWLPARRFWSRWTDSLLWKDRLLTLKAVSLRRWHEYMYQLVLLRNLRSLRYCRSLDLLAILCHEAAGDRMRWGETNWGAFAKKRGRFVGRAVKAGCKRGFGKLAPPLLPHEKPAPTAVPSSVIVGLVGIQALLDDGEMSVRSMSDDQVRAATRYAVNELNGFPAWLGEIATIRPGPVGEVLGDCVRGEWEYEPGRSQPFDVLSDLATQGGELAHLARGPIIDLLRKGDPGNQQIFEFALEVLLKTAALPDPDVAALAAERCRAEASVATDSFALWAVVCLQFDADEALTILEDRLATFEGATEVLLNVCNVLNGEFRSRLTVLAQPDFLRPAALRKLIPFVFRYILPKDDIDRAGTGPYTPTARDQASRFRDRLLAILSESVAPDAVQVLQELRDLPELASRRDWILHLIEQRATKDANIDPWNPADLRGFAAASNTAPHDAPSRSAPTPGADVLVVTVNEHETRAVIDAFKAATGREGLAASVGGRVYHDLGVINGTAVFHVISEMGSGGVGGMQQTVDKAIRALNPNAVIAVGIAFGMNEDKQAIGDILISKQLRLYELQRIGKMIVLRGARPDASSRLVNYFRTFGQAKWHGARVAFGLMLTGEKLVDDLDYRAQLATFESEAIGGEMEGAGLYVSGADHKVDWIVVKAICDFADGNKGKDKEQRQIVAATNAAKFLVNALQYTPLKWSE